MTFKLIDQALTAAISLLIYGSEFWFTLAFVLYVATHDSKKLEKTLPVAKLVAKTPAFEKDSFEKDSFIAVQAISVSEKAPSAKVFSEKSLSPKALSPKISAAKISEAPISQPIICEPVNWKKWKAADLRKASTAKVCGVRMTPIGSRRKLTKADLIAQYEQNLKRLTRSPMPLSASLKSSQTA